MHLTCLPQRFRRLTPCLAVLLGACQSMGGGTLAASEVQAFEALPISEGGKRTVVISGAGDRRDEDIREQTRILGAAFDEVILYQDACQRGRADGEVIALLQQGLEGASRTRHTESIQGEFNAIDTALARLSPGDLCLILIDQVEEALAYIRQKVASASA